MNPTVPAVEVAHDADAVGIRRPHREGDTVNAFKRTRVRPHRLPEAPVRAFAEVIDILLAENRTKGIGITQRAGHHLTEFENKRVSEMLRPVREEALIETLALQTGHLDRLAAIGRDMDVGRVRAKNPQHHALARRVAMQTEKAERIPVCGT